MSRFVLRRRCFWCGVQLRGWQLNACRRCKHSLVWESRPKDRSGSRWNALPDKWRSWR